MLRATHAHTINPSSTQRTPSRFNMSGFCPVPHTFRDQVWLGVGAVAGAAVAYSFFSSKKSSLLDGLELAYWNGCVCLFVCKGIESVCVLYTCQPCACLLMCGCATVSHFCGSHLSAWGWPLRCARNMWCATSTCIPYTNVHV